jgi:hypothetical protein
MATRKRFELLDCPKFATPSLTEMDVVSTAANIADRLEGKGFLNYGQIWPRMNDIVDGVVDDKYVKDHLSKYKADWKNENLQEVARLLASHFGGKGKWFAEGVVPFEVLPGAYFKPSIRGRWHYQKASYSVGINARKRQRLFPDHVRFLARGIYELHSIDDPNDPTPLIVDLSVSDEGKRKLRTFQLEQEQMMPLEQFEHILRQFFEALSLAGVTTIPEKAGRVTDLFRKRRFD